MLGTGSRPITGKGLKRVDSGLSWQDEDGAVGIGLTLHPPLLSVRCPRPPTYHSRYRKAFDVEPSLHSGINAAVLLIAAGQRFEDSKELRLIGEPPSCTPVYPLTHRGSEGKERGLWAGAGADPIPIWTRSA